MSDWRCSQHVANTGQGCAECEEAYADWLLARAIYGHPLVTLEHVDRAMHHAALQREMNALLVELRKGKP